MPKKFRIGSLSGIALLFLFLTACGGSGGGSDGDTPTVRVVISSASGSRNLVPDGSLKLSANAEAVRWESLHPDIATIDGAGKVTGRQVGLATIVASSPSGKGSLVVGVVSPNPGAFDLAISGVAHYEDRLIGQNGFTGTILSRPIRNAVVHLIGIDGFTLLLSTVSGEDGRFSFSGTDHSGQRGGLFVRLRAETLDPAPVLIKNNADHEALYTQISSAYDDSLASSFSSTLTATVPGTGGAFNLLDQFLSAGRFLKSGCEQIGQLCIPPPLTAYWQPSAKKGTHFDMGGGGGIFICGERGGGDCDPGDGDEYDDSVALHEYGHFILHHLAKDDSPGGAHFLSENTQDVRLAWSEGWATFFSSAVRNDPSHFDGNNSGGLLYEIEQATGANQPDLPKQAVYLTNELSVAAILWDALDRPLFDDDPLALDFGTLWEATPTGSSAATAETFQRRFADQHVGTDPYADDLQQILRGRKVELFADDAETAGEALLAAGGVAQFHTLFLDSGAADTDRIPFQVDQNGTYLLETTDLKNGADTYLAVTNASGQLLFSNDNRSGLIHTTCTLSCPMNTGTALASSLQIVWAGGSTQLYAQVTHSSEAPPSAGENGSYNLRLHRQK
jgi:hypothetical protein